MAEHLDDLTPEIKAAIGSAGDPVTYEVTAPGIRLFARALGYTNAIYYDEAAAKANGHRGLPAPPGFFGSPIYEPGGTTSAQPQFDSPFERRLNGGTEVEPIRQVYAGDVLTAITTLTDIQLRESRLGQMLITTSETVYRDRDGEVVARTRGTGLAY